MNIDTTTAERAVIGAAMIEAAFVPYFVSELSADSFTDPARGRIYQEIAKLHEAGQAVDLVTLSTALDGSGICASYLAEIMCEVPTAANAHAYLSIVQEAHKQRVLARGLREALEQTENGTGDGIAAAQAAIDAANALGAMEIEPIGAYAMEAVQAIGEKRNSTPTGFCVLDKTLDGLHGGDLVILAARPSVGKTALAMNIATNIVREGTPVAMFELEMDKEKIAQRIAHSLSRISRAQVMTGNATAAEKITQAAEDMAELPLHIIDRSGMTFAQIKAQCYRIKQRGGLGLIVVDYLGLIKTSQRRNGTREQEVAELSRSFKLLARELDCPILLLCQLNRGVESRTDATPSLSDLRESGAIEQDADAVLLLYRDKDNDRIVNLRIAKNRNGEVGTIPLYFHGEHFLFQSGARA